MRRRLALSMLAALMVPVHGASAADGDTGRQPFELVRSLRAVQDQVARGSEQAHSFQRLFLERIAQNIRNADPEVWKDRRNVRAAIVYVLSGGDPRVLRDTMTKFVLTEADDGIWRGAIAYAEGRTGEAGDLLMGLTPRTLEPSLAGQIALVQAVLTLRRDPPKAMRLLDDARLLAPGTLIEEAALRRQISLLAASKEFDRFEDLSLQYLRRFGRSLYIDGFLQQFVRILVSSPEYADDARVQRLKARLDVLDAPVRRDTFLAIAEEAIIRGRVALTRLAARRAAELVAGGSPASARVQVYEAAALIVTEAYEQGLGLLDGLDRRRLDEADVSLLEAARQLAGEVRRKPQVGEPVQIPASSVLQRAERAIVKVDEYLPRAAGK